MTGKVMKNHIYMRISKQFLGENHKMIDHKISRFYLGKIERKNYLTYIPVRSEALHSVLSKPVGELLPCLLINFGRSIQSIMIIV